MARPEQDPNAPAGPVPDWNALAREFPLLAALPPAVRRRARLVSVVRLATVFMRGDRPRDVFVVLSGEVHLVRRSRSGSEIILQRTHRGFLAEASLDQPAYHCDAVAVAPSRLLAVPRKAFMTALADARFRDAWTAHLTRELRRARAHAERLSLKTARERVVHFIETEGQAGAIDLTCSRKEWAAELGLSHEALYRTLARMRKDCELAVDQSTLVLRD